MPREVYPPPRAKSIEHVIQVSNCLRTVVGSESPRRATTGRKLTLVEIADELSHRLTRIFLRDKNGRRPVFRACEKMQTDPHFRDYVLFYEYFDGDNGRGVGASHQTGWTGLIANLIDELYPPEP